MIPHVDLPRQHAALRPALDAAMALASLDVGPGDEVITPAFPFVASASTILWAGATPVFVDVDPETYALDVAALERAITPKTRGLTLPVQRRGAHHVYHLYVVRHPQRDALAKMLADLGVGTAVHYPIPIPAQPMFGNSDERAWPEAWRAAREVLSLPCFAELTDQEVEEVARAVRRACERF